MKTGCAHFALFSFAVFLVGMSAGVALARKAAIAGQRLDVSRLEHRQVEIEVACHDDRVRAEALSDQCARLADHECAGPFQR